MSSQFWGQKSKIRAREGPAEAEEGFASGLPSFRGAPILVSQALPPAAQGHLHVCVRATASLPVLMHLCKSCVSNSHVPRSWGQLGLEHLFEGHNSTPDSCLHCEGSQNR